MSLFETITSEMKSAMKAGDKVRLEVLRFVLAGLQSAQKEKGIKEPGAKLTDEEVIAILQKEAKRRKEAIELFKQGNRADLVEKESADLAIISAYLPAELSEQEIEKVVNGLYTQGFNEFNTLMREAMKVLKGKADGKVVGDMIKKKLG
jgi:uncharacterized protein YqeY